MSWPPRLEDHAQLTPWRAVPAEDVESIRAAVPTMGPCEAVECVARSLRTHRRELVLAFRPRPPSPPPPPAEEPAEPMPSDELGRAIARARQAQRGRR